LAGKVLSRRAKHLYALSSLAIPVSLDDRGRRYAAYPGFSRIRWLLPRGQAQVRRAALKTMFQPRSRKGKVLKKLVSTGAIRGRDVYVKEAPLGRLEAELSRILGSPEVSVAFYIGTPGAYRKATAQVLTPRGETLAFAKIAASPITRANVETERRNLLMLSTNGSLRDAVPEVLGHFSWETANVLVTTEGPARPGPDELALEHLDFLRTLFLGFVQEVDFAESRMLSDISERIERLSPDLPGGLPELFRRAMDRLVEGIGGTLMPLSVVHRDFAPWNTRLGGGRLFVFDWDGAASGFTPLYDAFHFQSIKAALFGNTPLVPDPWFSRALLDSVWPEGRAHLPHLYLAYLLDISLLYGEARVTAPDAGESGVWRWFNARLHDFLRGETPF
jgi:hypothetical protein